MNSRDGVPLREWLLTSMSENAPSAPPFRFVVA